ncbi:unnamed protein product, partial [Iphiclides podalirius]
MDKSKVIKLNNSAAKNCVSKSWTHNRTTETRGSGPKATPRLQGRKQFDITEPLCYPSMTTSSGARQPCAYCSSWLSASTDADSRAKVKDCPAPRTTPTKRDAPIAKRLEPPTSGPNPYAPHLKYGIFPQNRNRPTSPTKRASRSMGNDNYEAMKEASRTSSPFFSVRPLEQQDLEIASRAEMMVAPDRFSGLPAFNSVG